MRIQFLDALRGISAVAVMLHHYNTRIEWSVFDYGNLGVAVFFVLSGFVIAMSVADAEINARFIGRFALRRAVRLDPPYWAAIASVILIGYVFARFVKFGGATVPQVIAHMFYLQDALAYKPLLSIFWTLCYEVQFYLALIVLLWGVQLTSIKPYVVLIATLVMSIADRHFEITQAAFMGRFWFCFVLGALAYLHHRARVRLEYVVMTFLAVLLYGLLTKDGYALTASLSASVISVVLAMRRPDYLSGIGWQFLGKISYSLYLTHLLFGWFALRMAERFVPVELALVIGIAVAIASAWLFYRLIEMPSVQLSRRFRV